MRIILWAPRNDLTGNRKLITMLARELGQRHAVQILYPVIPDLVFNARHARPVRGIRRAVKYVRDMMNYLAHPRWQYGSLLGDGMVRVTAYWEAIPRRMLEQADVVVYSSVYQALELDAVPHGRAVRVFYVMHEQSRTDAHVIEPALTQQTYRRADYVIALSEETQRHLGELGVRSETVVPAGIDTSVFRPPAQRRDGPAKILANFWPGEVRKGAGVLRQALEQVRARHPEVAISLLAEPGASLPGCQTFSEVSEPNLAELYRQHDIFVYPSIGGGGFGLPPLEAMACGCAVVSTAVGAIGDFAQHGVSALLCDPNRADQLAESIERLIVDAPLRETLRTEAASRASAWSWARAAERLEHYLTQVVPGA